MSGGGAEVKVDVVPAAPVDVASVGLPGAAGGIAKPHAQGDAAVIAEDPQAE